ncbi:MAG TPA: (2Fe-2S)-binding protein [Vicinamibacteria bacterium]|nr:(2Fe-2S)-binding protein [Vicinamibacteria bacterium]
MSLTVRFKVNGTDRSVTTDPQRRLLDVLREDLQLTGTKYGCGEGQCGACLVYLDGEPARSCLLPVTSAEGKSVTTIEGLARGETLHAVQEAFLEEGALQCGYCASGMILEAAALLRRKDDPTDEEIVSGMNGHLCRCNGYVRIVSAVRRAAATMRGARHG